MHFVLVRQLHWSLTVEVFDGTRRVCSERSRASCTHVAHPFA